MSIATLSETAIFFLYVLLIAPGIWRMSSLLANEDGPFAVFKHLREQAAIWTKYNWLAKRFHLYEGLCCEWCNSMWIGIPTVAALYFLGPVVVWLILPFSLSMGAIFFKFIIQTLEQLCDYVVKLNKIAELQLTPPHLVKPDQPREPDWSSESFPIPPYIVRGPNGEKL